LVLSPVVLVIGLASWRVAALPALCLGTAAGCILAVGWQGVPLQDTLAGLYTGHTQASPHPAVVSLLSRGGMAGMLDTIAPILTATAFGGMLERAGFVSVLLMALMRRVHSAAGLLTATVFSAIGVNFIIAEQYLAIVLPGRLFKPAYDEMGLDPVMLSRTLEDAGTVTSPLCPWNSCGAYMAATLGVSTFAYAPFALFNLSMPIIAILWAWLGWFVFYKAPSGPASAT
jgi:NhaC family Na+:H+ antiporter